VNAEFYFNDVFIGKVTNLIVQVAEIGFLINGPKAVLQFISNKEVAEQWFIVHTLNYSKNSFNKILLITDSCDYEILSLDSIMVIPIVDSNNWKFKIRVFKEEGLRYSKNT